MHRHPGLTVDLMRALERERLAEAAASRPRRAHRRSPERRTRRRARGDVGVRGRSASRLSAAVLVLGLPVAVLAIVDRLGESPLGLAAGVVVLLGALAIVGAVSRRLDRWKRRLTATPSRTERRVANRLRSPAVRIRQSLEP
jgi:hypothetical protein